MVVKKIYEDILYLIDFYKSKKNPLDVQKNILMRILSENKNTIYGKKYDFENIKSIEDFVDKVPEVNYLDIKQYIDRIKDGEQNVLTDDVVEFFATSSGTTSEPKFIPVTKKRLEFFQREFFLLTKYEIRKDIGNVKGKMLSFAAASDLGKTSSGIPYGNISGYLFKNLSFMKKVKLVLNYDVYNIKDVDKRTEVIALKSLAEKNITKLSFPAPIEVMLFCDYLKKNKDILIKKLKKNGCSKNRIKELESIEDFIPINIWPYLRTIYCIKAEMMKLYMNTLFEKIGCKLPSYDQGIVSSEGRINLGISGGDDNGFLILNSNFFEFCEKIDDKFLEPVTVDKLKVGSQYKVLMTTFEGLYRYDVGDVVEIVGFDGRLPIVKFADRDKYLNVIGENMSEVELVNSVESSSSKLNLKLRGFVCLPYIRNTKDRPKYEFLVEFVNDVSDDDVINLLNEIENYLQKNVLTYKKARNEFGRMDYPVLSVVKRGEIDKWEKERMKVSSQMKPIHVSKDPEFRKRFEILKEF